MAGGKLSAVLSTQPWGSASSFPAIPQTMSKHGLRTQPGSKSNRVQSSSRHEERSGLLAGPGHSL